jgi:hypothetical protein
MWAVLGRDGQLMSEQETLLYLEVMMMMIQPLFNLFLNVRKLNVARNTEKICWYFEIRDEIQNNFLLSLN